MTKITEKSILVVEDNEIMASYTNTCLIDMGHRVVSIEKTGMGAVNSALEHKPDLVLMDIVLEGEMNGLEAAGKIKSELGTPVIFITSLSDEDTLNLAKNSNFQGYIVKPFRPEELRNNIEIIFNRKRLKEKKIKKLRLILNTSSFVGESIKDKLNNIYDIEILDEKLSEKILKSLLRNMPHVLIIDTNLYQDYEEFENTLLMINEFKKQIKVLVFLHNYDKKVIFKSILKGVMGILGTRSHSWQLVPAVESVINNRVWIDNEIISDLFSDMSIVKISEKIRDANFTKRETEIFELIAKGMSNKQISDDLSISEKTVKNNITSIFEKFGVEKREEIIAFYKK